MFLDRVFEVPESNWSKKTMPDETSPIDLQTSIVQFIIVISRVDIVWYDMVGKGV